MKYQKAKPQFTKNQKSGFTLVELIVSLGLFMVVMMISTGAMLTLAGTNRKVQSQRIAMDNLNLALESMSREIRMGTVYHCDYYNIDGIPVTSPRNCGNGSNSFTFFSQDGNQITYRLNNESIERSINYAAFSSLTASDIIINPLWFHVMGAQDLLDNSQPLIVISIGGTVGSKISSTFNIQTTITQRVPKK